MSMFRRKSEDQPQTRDDAADDLALTLKPVRPAASVPSARSPSMPTRPAAEAVAAPRETARVTEMPRRFEQGSGTRKSESSAELRTLIVGREIALSGEITSCDKLVVEGSVEANLANCRDIDIAESGLFKGSASIDEAEIRGRFEGVLTVKKRLLIRSTGKVIGKVRYGQVEIERGGQISGEISSSAVDAEETGRPGLKAVGEN
jgi:cytoskeletal protein CcmA (bactofilin family)